MKTNHVAVRLECSAVRGELAVRELSGRERISTLFDFDVLAVALDPESVDEGALLGSTVALVFERAGAEVRRVHGMIAELDDRLDTEATTRTYRMRIVPRAFRMTLVETQEVFMNLSVPEIVAEKAGLVGLGADVDVRLSATYAKQEYVTQYKESDLAFVSRLMEHVGISFFFEHGDDRDRMVLTDNPGGFAALGGETLEFRRRGEQLGVFAIEAQRRLLPSAYVVQDYNYRNPQLDLVAEHAIEGGFAGGIVEYGAHFKTPEEGRNLARIRAEERRAGELVYVGRTELGHLAAGAHVTLTGHPTLGDLDVLVVEVEHRVSQVVAAGGGEVTRYTATFRAIPRDRPFRPRRVTPRPRIHGIVSGIVDDAKTTVRKYAQIDEDGRYVVRLLFDTADAGGRFASRPIRMAQPHAGADYGMHFPLKPGVEVLLAFVDGDPDRPIIVGAVHNGVTPSPVDARSATLNRLKSASGIVIEYGDRRT